MANLIYFALICIIIECKQTLQKPSTEVIIQKYDLFTMLKIININNLFLEEVKK